MLAVSLMVALMGLFGLSTVPAQATPSNDNPCGVEGWYVNPDEAAYTPERTYEGFLFEGKDLIHHEIASPMDLPDVKTETLTFEATTAGKVVGKMETMNPYSTIVQNADGKFWSTAMTYAQEGGQGHPVENVSDLIGKDVKPGKVKFGETSKVTTFGVGYWVEEGSTTVTSITFHGKTYDLTCDKTPPTTPPVTNPPVNEPTDPPADGGNGGGDTDEGNEETLPVTGSPAGMIAGGGAILLILGGCAYVVTRRRSTKFTA